MKSPEDGSRVAAADSPARSIATPNVCNPEITILNRHGQTSFHPSPFVYFRLEDCETATVTWVVEGEAVEFTLPNDDLLEFSSHAPGSSGELLPGKELKARVKTHKVGSAGVVFSGSPPVNSVVIVE